MILQCEQCKARFKLDDEKIKNDGVKVRCSKCKHVFFVKKETAQDEADYDTLLSGLGSSVQPPSAPPAASAETFGGFAEQSPFQEEPSLPATSLSGDEDAGAFSFSDEALDSFASQPADHESQGFDVDEFSFDDEQTIPPEAEPDATTHADSADFFPDTDFVAQSIAREDDEPHASSKGMGEEFAFDFDEPPASTNSDEVFLDEKTIAGPFVQEEDAEDTVSYETDETAFSMEAAESSSGSDQERPDPVEFSIPEQPKTVVQETFVPDSFAFGEAADSEPVAEEKMSDFTPTMDEWKVSLPPSSELEPIPFPSDNEPLPDSDEIPPFSASVRRSGFPSFPLTSIILGLLLVLGISAAGLYFVKSGPAVFRQMGLGFVPSWLGMATVEEGSIVIVKPVAAFQHNKEVGELFVVSGEVVNNFTKPRASIHIKVTLFDSKGSALLSKGAYCGNRLSSGQLATLTMVKIDEAMNNQFGDSLSNLGVKPGKGLPFVVAFANPPPEAVDYTVEVTGSTVASQ